MPVDSIASVATPSPTTWYLPSGIFMKYTQLTFKGAEKRASSCGGQRVLKSVSWKNSQLLSTWPYTIVRKRRGGDEWSDGRGGGVGGRRLKLHHKSHPERKHEMVPPPFFHLPLSPFGPALSCLLLSSSLPPFVSVHRERPVDGPGVFYITPSCTSNAKHTNLYSTPSSFHLPCLLFLSCVATSLLQVYKSLSRPDWQRTGRLVENTGDGEKLPYIRDEVKCWIYQRSKIWKNNNKMPLLGFMHVSDQFRLKCKHPFRPPKDTFGWKNTKGKENSRQFPKRE